MERNDPERRGAEEDKEGMDVKMMRERKTVITGREEK